nr:transposase [uncultured Bacteroides sp.]
MDEGKKTKERKRHIVVYTMGLLMAVVVHAANIHDSKGAPFVFSELKSQFHRLVKIEKSLLKIQKIILTGYLKLRYKMRTLQNPK